MDLVLHYRPGKTDGAADSLSRFVVQPLRHDICEENHSPLLGSVMVLERETIVILIVSQSLVIWQ